MMEGGVVNRMRSLSSMGDIEEGDVWRSIVKKSTRGARIRFGNREAEVERHGHEDGNCEGQA